jgi:hypothetical protein
MSLRRSQFCGYKHRHRHPHPFHGLIVILRDMDSRYGRRDLGFSLANNHHWNHRKNQQPQNEQGM